MEQVKPFYLSKTLWTNLLLGVLMQIPSVQSAVGGLMTEENLAMVFMVVNIALRAVTKEKLALW